KSPQGRVDPWLRNRRARRGIFREACRIAGGEGPSVPSAIARHRVADRSFGRDMDRIGLGNFDAASDLAPTRQRQAQSGIGRYRNAAKTIRGEEFNVAPEASSPLGQ